MFRKQDMTVRVDGYTRVCLTVIAVLLTVLIVGLWADGPGRSDEARAAEPFLDSSAQRAALLKSQDKTNSKLTELIGLLKSGKAKFTLAKIAPSATKGGTKDVRTPAKK